MVFFNFHLISNVKVRVLEYIAKRITAGYIHENHPINNNLNVIYNEGNLVINLKNIVLDPNLLNRKISNIYYLSGDFLNDLNEDTHEDNNPNLPIIFSQNPTIDLIEIDLPIMKFLDVNVSVKVYNTRICLKLSLLSDILGKKLKTNLKEYFRNSLMSGSIQLVEEYIENTVNQTKESFLNDENISGYEGYKALADIIKNAISRVETTFSNLILIFEDDDSSTVEIRIKNIEMKNEKNAEKSPSYDKDEEVKISKEEEKNNKKLVKLIEIEHIEVFVNSTLICKNIFKHSIKYDVDNNNIEICISSILNLVLTTSQLESIIKIFTKKADESKIANLNLKNDSQFFDKKITKEEFKKVKEYLLKEKKSNKVFCSNKLNNLEDHSWSPGFGLAKNNDDIKFYKLKNCKNDIDNETLIKQNEPVKTLSLLLKIPAITCSLMAYEQLNELITLDEINIDLEKIYKYLNSKKYIHQDRLELILYNFNLEYNNTFKIKLSNLSLIEVFNNIREDIIICNRQDSSVTDNIQINFDLSNNHFNISTKFETLINIDLTLIERLHNYLSFYFLEDVIPNFEKSTILKSPEKSTFKILVDFQKINGRVFFPVPNLSENLPHQFSDLRNETIEFKSTNLILIFMPENLKLYSGFIELYLNENYLTYRNKMQSDEPKIELKSIKVAEIRSLKNNLIELIIIFKTNKNSSLLIKEIDDFNVNQKTNPNLNSLNEDSVYMNNIYNLNSSDYLPFKTRKKKIIREDKDDLKETEMILPNDKNETTKYLNAAAKVSKINVIINIPQFLILFSHPQELNLIYNKLVNDLILWSPFNGVDKKGNRNNGEKTKSTDLLLIDKNIENLNQSYHLYNSDGTSSIMDNSLVQFDENVYDHSKNAKHKRDLITECLESLDENHFTQFPKNKSTIFENEYSFEKKNSMDLMSTSLYLCKNNLEESDESENLYHSLTYSVVNPIYGLTNKITLVINIGEIALHFEHSINLDDVKNIFKSQKPEAKLNNSFYDFFNNYQLIENQTIVGKNVLVGCVAKMEKDNTTRIFLHGENIFFKMNNLGPVNKIQAACVQNNQFFLIGGNKLVNNSDNCKLNFGIEIKCENENLKKIKMAIQLTDAILFQISYEEILKFWSYLKVVDDKIIGYTQPKILIELHVNLLNTALFLEPECFCNNFNNPFYLGEPRNKLISSMKNNQSFKITSSVQNDCINCNNIYNLENRPGLLLCDDTSIICLIMENTSDILLKFTFDELALFFAKKILNYDLKPNNDSSKNSPIILNNISLTNYVCNVNCGLLEINILLSDGELREIKLNNDLINVNCCYDSLAAFICFLQKYSQTNKKNDHEQKKTANQNKCSFLENQNAFPENLHNINYQKTTIVEKNKKDKESFSLLYDPSFLEDDEEDARINLMNQIKQPKFNDNLNLDSSFYIFGVDDFGNGIKDFENVEPEYTNLSWGFNTSLECYFNVPQMVNVPIFTPQSTLLRFFLQEMSINFHIFGGTDFFETNSQINEQKNNKNFEFQDNTVLYKEDLVRRSSTSSLSSYSSMYTANSTIKPSTVRFTDNQQRRDSLISNEKTYEKTNSNLSKFDYLATNFLRRSYSIRRNSCDIFDLIKSNSNDTLNIKINDGEAFWEDLDLFSSSSNYDTLNNIFRSNINVAILKKSGGVKRNNQLYVKLHLKKMKCLFEKYFDVQPIAWNISYACSEIELLDFVEESHINKILYEYITDTLPKRSQPMLSIKMINNRNTLCDQKIHSDGSVNNDLSQKLNEKLNLKRQLKKQHTLSETSDYSTATSPSLTFNSDNLSKQSFNQYNKCIYDPSSHDCDLVISMNPLRVNLDQDTILFLMNFLNDLSIILEQTAIYNSNNLHSSASSINQHVDYYSDTLSSGSTSSNKSMSNKQPIFIKHFEFSQDVPIKLDYYGKRVDMKVGAIKGLLMGLAQLNGSELTLKSFVHRHGILGFEKLILFVIDFWGMDIKKHQLPSILGGVGPVNSFIQLFRGIRDLFLMPIDQYRKDKRLVRGLQKGLFSFSTSSTIALLELTNKSLGIIEFASQLIYDFMSGTNTLRKEHTLALNYEKSIRWNQPRDAREGALNAYNVLTEGFQQASRNLTMIHNSNTALSLIRKIPANAFILPILTTQATSNMLIGVRNQMTPQARKEEEDKWKKKKN